MSAIKETRRGASGANEEPMIGSRAAAEILGCTQRNVHKLAAAGRLPCTPVRRGLCAAYLFRRAEVERFRDLRDAWRRGVKPDEG